MPAAHFKTGGKLNLLFFGSFCRLDEEDFLERLMTEMEDEEQAFRMMARDLYQNGVVLERKKYRLLAYAYWIFLAGLVAREPVRPWPLRRAVPTIGFRTPV